MWLEEGMPTVTLGRSKEGSERQASAKALQSEPPQLAEVQFALVEALENALPKPLEILWS